MLTSSPEFADLRAAELEEIVRRRRALNLPPPRTDASGAPGGLVGLALSGGGIRSATFSLGVLQALAECRLLRIVDYLSTVSGGGFIGSCVSSLLNQPGTSPDAAPDATDNAVPFPLRCQPGEADTPALRHLRNAQDYLAEGGFMARVRIPALMMRGILLNLLFLCPYLLLAVGATALLVYWDAESENVVISLWTAFVLFGAAALASGAVGIAALVWTGRARRRGDEARAERLEVLTHRAFITAIATIVLAACVGPLTAIRALDVPVSVFLVLPAVAPAIFLLLVVTYPVASRHVMRGGWTLRNAYEASIAFWFLAALVSLLLWPFFALVARAVWMTPDDLAALLQPALNARTWLAVAGVLIATVVAGGFVPRIGAAVRQAGLMAAAASPLLLVAAYLALCVVLIDPPYADRSLGLSDIGLTGEDVQALNRLELPATVAGLAMPGSTRPFGVTRVSKAIEQDRAWRLEAPDGALVIAAATAGAAAGHHVRIWTAKPTGTLLTAGDWELLGFSIAWLLFNALFFNVNLSSAHGFYRDRLSQAYLLRRLGDSDDTIPADRQKLSDLNGPGTTAPYHLINVALELTGTADVNVRGRNCDFFTFSKHYCGGTRTGYCRTTELERTDPHIDLATAVAISGAAASPNAGTTTVAQFVALMTLLNVRLGYWLPNPALVRGASGLQHIWRQLRLRLGPGPKYLWLEALKAVDSRDAFVNLSDGGHVENLAIYELLRRRCRLIIAVDGEQDAALRFDGLLRLVLYARIDMGISIDVDLASLRAGDARVSRAHCVAARIDYGDAEPGWLLYLKASMTGDEDEIMQDYRVSHPEFPHQSTANQFFDERQFEMYRALGFHIASTAVQQVIGAAPERLADDNGFAAVQQVLARELLWTPPAAAAGAAPAVA